MLETMERPAPSGRDEMFDQTGAQPACRTGAAAYVEPRLVIYGSLRAITAAVGSKGMKDGSGSRKTGF
jgi:hypothetical protein